MPTMQTLPSVPPKSPAREQAPAVTEQTPTVTELTPPPFQFRLRTLMGFTAGVAVVSAILRATGIEPVHVLVGVGLSAVGAGTAIAWIEATRVAIRSDRSKMTANRD